jgi:hypothetical protein
MNIIVVQNPSGSSVPSGSLLFWSGKAGAIPTGWTLFNTPADAFIMGTNGAGINLTKAGANSHTHTNKAIGAGGAHSHTRSVSIGLNPSGVVYGYKPGSGASAVTGGQHSHYAGSPTCSSVLDHSDHTIADAGDGSSIPLYRRFYLMEGGSANVPVGAIMLWSGVKSSIPSGWVHCDGTGGAPDITESFMYIPTDDANQGTTGGSNTHGHTNPTNTGSGGNHQHALTSGNTGGPDRNLDSNFYGVPTDGQLSPSSSHTHSGISGNSGWTAHTHTAGAVISVQLFPPFIRLYYIMKVY